MSKVTEGWKIRSEWNDKTVPDMPAGTDGWKVVVTNPRGQRLQRQYFKGPGHYGAEPELDEFMNCMVSDAECVEYRSLEEFIEELGYEINSLEDARQVERTYKSCERIRARLLDFLTDEEWEYFRNI